MKIAMIGQKGIAPHAGGIEKHVEEIGSRLVERGHEVDVYCRRHYTRERGTYRGMKIRLLPAFNTKHLDAISHTLFSALNTLGKRYDIVHFHALGPTTMSFIPRLAGSKIVSTCHGLDWQREKWGRTARLALRFAEKPTVIFPHQLVTVSKSLADYFQRKYDARPIAIPNGVSIPEELSAVDIIFQRWQLGPPDGENEYLLFLSRLVPEKGAHLLIEAFQSLNLKMRLVIAGGASHSDSYVRRLNEIAKNDDRVIFTGSVTGPIWRELLSNAKLFILPSTLEGLPIVLLEAMAHARPCIASDIPENLEVIKDAASGEKYGYDFESGQASALQNKIHECLNNYEDAIEMGKKSRRMVSERFTWDENVNRLEALYRLCLED